MENNTLKSKLVRYIDAGFPILYINTFEEDKVDSIISKIASQKEVYEWNETFGYFNFETKTPLVEDFKFEQFLDILKTEEMLENKIIILKDIVPYLDDPKIVSKIKGIAKMINQGVDATLIIVSSTLVIPKDLE